MYCGRPGWGYTIEMKHDIMYSETKKREAAEVEGKGAYESPVFKEQKAKEELSDICMEILRDARNELYLSMRFLDVALSSLYFVPDFAVCGR